MAQRYIMAGQVYAVIAGQPQPVTKPGHPYPLDTMFEIRGRERFVSRGGYKLLTAIEHFGLEIAGKVCLDAGASTGGFTDCLLQHGAERVYAVDVGRAQLHERLKGDDRVISLEKVNLRHAPPDLLPEPVDLIVADVSFISLTMVLPGCVRFHKPEGEIVVLVKPQFELASHQTEKGVVRDEGLRREAIRKVEEFALRELGLVAVGCVPSAVLGPKGNQEYLLYMRATCGQRPLLDE